MAGSAQKKSKCWLDPIQADVVMAWDDLCWSEEEEEGWVFLLLFHRNPQERVGWACISCPQLALGFRLKGPWAVQLREAPWSWLVAP